MTHKEFALLWNLIDRADGRFDVRDAWYLLFTGHWDVAVHDHLNGLDMYYIHYASFACGFPDKLAYAPEPITPPRPGAARMSHREIRHVLDVLVSPIEGVQYAHVYQGHAGRYGLAVGGTASTRLDCVIESYGAFEHYCASR